MTDTTLPATGSEQSSPAVTLSTSETPGSPLRNFLKHCFSFRVLLGAILVTGVFVVERSIRLDPDTWWHLKVGSDILATHHFPVADHYSFTARGAPWIAYEWLGDVMIALAARTGLQGIDLLLMVGSSLIVVLTYYYAWLRCKECKAAFVATAAVVPLAMLSMTVRPQIFGYIFLLVTLICLERFRQGHHNALWILPPLFLVWVNTHGSFVLGFMALGLYWAAGLFEFSWGSLHAQRWTLGERIRLELAALTSVLMLPLTPYGTRLAMVPVEYALFLPGNMADIQEWQPANFDHWQVKVFLMLLLVLVVALLTLRPRYHLAEFSLFLFATYETCIHIRFAIVFAIIFAPMLATLLARWVDTYNPEIDKYALNALLILIAVVGWVKFFPSQATLEKNVASAFPVQAVRYLRRHTVPEPMLNSYGFGGYLVWAGVPRHGVFIDGRGDLYENAGIFKDFRRIVSLAPNTVQLLRRYNVQSCLLKKGVPLATFLSADPGWKRIYHDKLTDLFVRVSRSGHNLTAPHTQSRGLD